jgi:hypothetical protein
MRARGSRHFGQLRRQDRRVTRLQHIFVGERIRLLERGWLELGLVVHFRFVV